MTIAWDHSTREFARVLSLARPNVPVPYKDVARLAREVLRAEGHGATDMGLAFDAGPAMVDALEELQDHLRKCIRDPDDLHKACELANGLANSALRDEDLKRADAIDAKARRARDADLTRYRQPSDLSRQAEDAGSSVLDSVLRGLKPPLRL